VEGADDVLDGCSALSHLKGDGHEGYKASALGLDGLLGFHLVAPIKRATSINRPI
jgi:hypothetical protein